MKTQLLIVILLFTYKISVSQTTAIRDVNFEQALIDAGIDTNGLNGNILNSDTNNVYTIDVSNKNISDLTGLEAFTSLQIFNCSNNNITSLDVSNAGALYRLYCQDNFLTSLNVTNNPSLEILYCSGNLLTSLNTGFNNSLKELYCFNNTISTLNLGNNPDLRTLNCRANSLGSLNLNNNTDLISLKCYDNFLTSLYVGNNPDLTLLECFNNLISNLNLVNNTSLIELRCYSNNLTTLNLPTTNTLTEIFCEDNQLTSLTIPNNTSLETLNCYNNNLQSLTIPANITLENIDCRDNALETIDVSESSALKSIQCQNNSLTRLNVKNGNNTNFIIFAAQDNPNLSCIEVDNSLYSSDNWGNVDPWSSFVTDCNFDETYISDTNFEQALIDLGIDTNGLNNSILNSDAQNVLSLSLNSGYNIVSLNGIEAFTSLTNLSCQNSNITNLDLSKNTALTFLDCRYNNLYTLNVKNGNNSNVSILAATNNPNLGCIEVDNGNYSTANWPLIDAQSSFSDNCSYAMTYVPDNNFEQALINMGFDSGYLDDYVLTANINTLTTLDLGSKNISDLTGIEGFMALQSLTCSQNNLTVLDVSNNTALNYLDCGYNQIESLDLSLNTNLQTLFCYENVLTELDLSLNNQLTELDCQLNNLSVLNVKNGNNTSVTYFDARYNPELTCVQVDNKTYSISNWPNLDAQTSFSTDCHFDETFIPDNNFEQALIDLGYDSGPLDKYVLTANINTVTLLSISSKNISDLTGIEDFTALERLLFSNNSVTTIDLSNNTNIWQLFCYNNNLTSLDISNLSLLSYMSCGGNNLTELETGSNPLLSLLYCRDNTISSLDLTNNLQLALLYAEDNQLTELDLSNHTQLYALNLEGNKLDYLNIKHGSNTNVVAFNTLNNPNLECISVDDISYSEANWTQIDGQTTFSGLCEGTYVPDGAFEIQLYLRGLDGTGAANDNYVLTEDINTLTELDLSNTYQIQDLTGIEDFVALEILNVNGNLITSLDLSKNIELEELQCSNNQLSSLDLSQNIALTDVSCNFNNITDFDLSQNLALTSLTCNNNELTSLNVKNGNNTNVTYFNTQGNTDLDCIEVDNTAYSTANWTLISSGTSFSTNCSGGNILISPKVFLQGPLLNPDVTGQMNDDLRSGGYLPTTSPYADTITCNASVFNATGSNAIIDWVWIELRDSTDPTITLAETSALLQRDGDVVDVDGTSDVLMQATPENYYVVVNHRNHLGAMSATAIGLSGTPVTVNFTNSGFSTYGNNAQATLSSGITALWAGNVNGDDIIQYSGTNPESPSILSEVLNDSGNFLNFPTYVIDGYNDHDVNMDNKTQYTGTTPDTPFILQNILVHPGNFLNFSTYQIQEQLPINLD